MAFTTSSYAINIVDDNFSIDGTATTDATYFGSSSSSAIELNANSIGLVSGSSSRQIHSLFDTQTLANPGDTINAVISFTTPTTVAAGTEDIRIGLFDHLERNTIDQLAQNTNYSTTTPNASYSGLPGFYIELDVESADPATDINIRRSDPSESGRLLATSTGFTSFGSGPDLGYVIEPNTEYTVALTAIHTTAGSLDITAEFNGSAYTVTDVTPSSFNFGMLAISASTNAFGSTNAVGDDPNVINDNGIDINSVSVEFTAGDTTVIDEPEPETNTPVFAEVVNDVFAIDGTDPTITDASYFASSSSAAIEFNADTVGLVSGSSSRQIHSLFETQTLGAAGDFVEATITFTTPATIGLTSEEIRIGLFDHLERTSATELGQNTSYSTASPNPSYEGLPGFYLELDVESADPATDLDIRRSDPSVTGRSIATSSGFSSLGNGPDVGYVFEPNTEYTVVLTVTRTETNALDITAQFAGETFVATDLIPASFNIGMLAINSSSGAFGSSNAAGELDNGIDLTSFVVQSTTTAVTDGGGNTGGGGVVIDNTISTGSGSDVSAVLVGDDFATNGTLGADASYFSSNSGNAIEFNDDSIGVVSGSSGRQIHSIFPTQSLDRVGDILRATLSFTTPETVSVGNDDIRFGLFDHLGRDSNLELGANTTFSSSNPSELYSGLPGYYVEIDVERFSSQTDLAIGKSNPTETGRLLSTTNGFLRENGQDIGYTIVPNTDYTVYLTAERTVNGIDVTANFLGRSFTMSDVSPLSADFSMMALNVSAGAMGNSNVPGEADNGLDITSFNVEFIRSSVVNDNLAADGTTETDIGYFASSTSSAIEINANSVGLVSGTSGRQIHGLFDSQSLVNAGDVLQTSVTFVTPATVATAGEDIRIGLFDSLGRTGADQLGQNTSFGSTAPNLDFSDLPGFYLELDVENADPGTDLDIRKSDPSTTGRLLTTSTGFTALGRSDDIGYVIEPNTEYTVDFTLVRTDAGELEITTDFLGNSFTVVDTTPVSFDFGMFAFYANSNAVGSSNAPATQDNGIDITNVTVNYTGFFSPEVVELPPVELPIGDHPEIELIPTLGEGVFVPPVTTETVFIWEERSRTIVFFGRTFTFRYWALVQVEQPVDVELTNAEQNALHFDIDPEVQPWENYDLTDWALDTPNADNGPLTTAAGNEFGNGDDLSARTQDFHFVAGELFPGAEPFFFTGSDGAMVFKSTIAGARTSQNTSFVRSELREMLRAGNRSFSTQGVGPNNWALDHQPVNDAVGARGGRLTATLSVDQVTSTGAAGQVGRVIIGQIHAEEDEPLRLYYRQLPGNTRGGIYAVHEIRGGDDINIDIIGSLANDAADPLENGIAPGELFSYEITNVGAIIEIIIRKGDSDGEIIGETVIDMDNIIEGGTGYDVPNEWMYFKAGAYSQNNTGDGNDFDQIRFYRLENSH